MQTTPGSTSTHELLPAPLQGIVPPMVTPLQDRRTLDVAGLERLVEHLVQGGVAGVFVLGTTGEAPSLSHRLRRDLVERTCRLVNGRVPVLVGITDTSFEEAVELACTAADAGAQAVVNAAPYYFPADQPELLEYVTHLVPELPLPLFLYNMPSLTKVRFELDTVRRLMEMPSVVGIKDSSGDLDYFHDVVALGRSRPDWTVLIGSEQDTAAAVRAGGHGGVTGGANVWPQLFVRLYDAAVRGDDAAVECCERSVRGLHRIYQVGRHPSRIIKGIKCALCLRGVCSDFMAEPFHRFRDEERAVVKGLLEDMGLL